MQASDAGLPNLYRQCEGLATRRAKAFTAEELLTAGCAIRGADFELPDSNFESATSTQAWALEQQRAIAPSLDAFDGVAARRLACGVVLAERRSSPHARLLTDALNLVSGVMRDLDEGQLCFFALKVLTGLPPETEAPGLKDRVVILSSRIGAAIDRIGRELAVPCPSAITNRPMTVAAWCGIRSEEEGGTDPGVFDRVPVAYAELLGRVVMIVRTVEQEAPGADAVLVLAEQACLCF